MLKNLLSGGITEFVSAAGKAIDDIVTSDEEREALKLAMEKEASSIKKSQIELNATEAKHSSIFVAGWRPFIGWIGGIALAYQFVLYPLFIWLWTLGQTQGWIACVDCKPPPAFDAGPLFAIVTGMLGIGGMRSWDKAKNIDTRKIGK